MKISGQHVFITGGGSGIGLALAQAFLAEGSRVSVCGRNRERLELATANHPGLHTLVADIASEEGLGLIATELQGTLKDVSILVNNAAIGDHLNLKSDPCAATRIGQELATNLLAPIRLTSLFLPMLLKRPESAIVNITSGYALWPCPVVPGYAVSKAGLRAFTKILRTQVRGNLPRIFEVLPPLVDTALVSRVGRHKLTPERVAQTIIRGIANNREEICIGEVRLLRAALRLCPWLVERIMLRYPIDISWLDDPAPGQAPQQYP